MALYRWRCESCGQVTAKMLNFRPSLKDGACDCGGKLSFVSNTHSQTKEVIDNGLMARSLERPANTEELHAERNASAYTPDDEII